MSEGKRLLSLSCAFCCFPFLFRVLSKPVPSYLSTQPYHPHINMTLIPCRQTCRPPTNRTVSTRTTISNQPPQQAKTKTRTAPLFKRKWARTRPPAPTRPLRPPSPRLGPASAPRLAGGGGSSAVIPQVQEAQQGRLPSTSPSRSVMCVGKGGKCAAVSPTWPHISTQNHLTLPARSPVNSSTTHTRERGLLASAAKQRGGDDETMSTVSYAAGLNSLILLTNIHIGGKSRIQSNRCLCR